MGTEAMAGPNGDAVPGGPSTASVPAAAPDVPVVRPADASRSKEASDDASRLSAQSIHVIAQSIPNLPPLREEAAAALAPDAEYRIREIVQDSLKFMRHSRRRRLTTGDINAALRLRNIEPLYGFGQPQAGPGMRAEEVANGVVGAALPGAGGIVASLGLGGDASGTVAGVGAAGFPGKLEGVGVGDNGAATNGGLGEGGLFTRVDGVDDLYFVEDAEVNLKRLIETPLPAVPLDYAVTAHWLGIDGVQPTLPQNPMRGEEGATGPGLSGGGKDGGAPVGNSFGKSKEPLVKPRLKHILGKEMQLFYEHVTSALAANNLSQQHACLLSLSEEPGLNQLLPYFTLYVRESVHSSLKNLPFLFSLMRLSRALLTNPHLEIEPYLHQLLPPVLTCLVGKRLCAKPKDDHWALRDFAAELIADICCRFGKNYTTLQPRITKTLTSALTDRARPLTTHYGAIVGLGALGVHVVDLLLLPHIGDYSKPLLAILDETKAKAKSARRLEAVKVYGALAWAVTVSQQKTEPPALTADTASIASIPAGTIGELLPEYNSRMEALHGVYGAKFFPRSVVKHAAEVAATLFR